MSDELDPAALLRSLDPPRSQWRWRLLSLGIVLFALVLVADAVWRAVGHGEWIRLPGVPLLVVVAGIAASRTWERSEQP